MQSPKISCDRCSGSSAENASYTYSAINSSNICVINQRCVQRKIAAIISSPAMVTSAMLFATGPLVANHAFGLTTIITTIATIITPDESRSFTNNVK